MNREPDKFDSPWLGLLFVPIGVALAAIGFGVMTDHEVSYTDKFGFARVLRGEYAEMYAWCFILAGAAVIVAGLAIVFRETRTGRDPFR